MFVGMGYGLGWAGACFYRFRGSSRVGSDFYRM